MYMCKVKMLTVFNGKSLLCVNSQRREKLKNSEITLAVRSTYNPNTHHASTNTDIGMLIFLYLNRRT